MSSISQEASGLFVEGYSPSVCEHLADESWNVGIISTAEDEGFPGTDDGSPGTN